MCVELYLHLYFNKFQLQVGRFFSGLTSQFLEATEYGTALVHNKFARQLTKAYVSMRLIWSKSRHPQPPVY